MVKKGLWWGLAVFVYPVHLGLVVVVMRSGAYPVRHGM